jgi:hypothetical protein
MSIFNSISRGFGGQIGRRAANSMLNGSDKQKVYRTSATLTFWQGIKTILWFFPNLLVALVINLIYNGFTGDLIKKDWTPNFQSIVLMATIFSVIIGYNYYQDNKKNLI